MATEWSNNYLYDAMAAFVDTGNLQVLLVDTNDSFTKTTDRYVSDIDANELTGGGYTRKSLANGTVALNQVSHAVRLDADDVTWSALTGHTIEAAYVFENTGSDSTSKLVIRLDQSNISTTGPGVTLIFNGSDGIGYINT